MTPTARDALAVALVALAIVLSVVREAFAHGPEWDWIAREPRYKAADGLSCCSNDCSPDDASKFREDGDGIAYGGQKLLLSRPGIYLSNDPSGEQRWWRCKLGGQLRCIFKPSSGS